MSDKSQVIWTWIARVVVLLGMLAGVLSAAKQLPIDVHQYAALAVSALGIVSAWIYSFLPGKDQVPK